MGCIPCCMRQADGGGLTAAGRLRRESVRVQGAELLEEVVKLPEVARRLRVSPKSAYRWHQLWREGGAEALASRGPSGSRCRLSPRCLEKLAVYLEQGPAAHGWDQDQVWTAARVATLIGRKSHVSYSVSDATRMMHRLGFSPQIPARRAAERDEQAVKVWKEATRAEVEAPGRPAGAASASRTRQAPPGGRTFSKTAVVVITAKSAGRRVFGLAIAGVRPARPLARQSGSQCSSCARALATARIRRCSGDCSRGRTRWIVRLGAPRSGRQVRPAGCAVAAASPAGATVTPSRRSR